MISKIWEKKSEDINYIGDVISERKCPAIQTRASYDFETTQELWYSELITKLYDDLLAFGSVSSKLLFL